MITVLVTGAQGKMGQATVNAVQNTAELSLVGQLSRGDDLSRALTDLKPQVVVDFTTPDVVFQHSQSIIEAGAHPVIGTTGLSANQIESLQAASKSKQLGGLIAPNFSIGAVLLMKFAHDAAQYFPNSEIIEMHHPHKKDAPSGTAIKTAEMIAKGRKTTPGAVATAPSPALGEKHGDTPIHSVRLPGFLAHEVVIMSSLAETLTLRHDSHNRECFMPGVVLACQKVTGLKELVYGLEHLL